MARYVSAPAGIAGQKGRFPNHRVRPGFSPDRRGCWTGRTAAGIAGVGLQSAVIWIASYRSNPLSRFQSDHGIPAPMSPMTFHRVEKQVLQWRLAAFPHPLGPCKDPGRMCGLSCLQTGPGGWQTGKSPAIATGMTAPSPAVENLSGNLSSDRPDLQDRSLSGTRRGGSEGRALPDALRGEARKRNSADPCSAVPRSSEDRPCGLAA